MFSVRRCVWTTAMTGWIMCDHQAHLVPGQLTDDFIGGGEAPIAMELAE